MTSDSRLNSAISSPVVARLGLKIGSQRNSYCLTPSEVAHAGAAIGGELERGKAELKEILKATYEHIEKRRSEIAKERAAAAQQSARERCSEGQLGGLRGYHDSEDSRAAPQYLLPQGGQHAWASFDP